MGTNKDKHKIILTLPIIILILMVIQPLSTLYFGETIIIKTEPHDPRDLFRGDYVELEYEINKIPIELIAEGEKGKRSTETIYVVLKEEKGLHIVDYATIKKPKTGLYLKGKKGYISKGDWITVRYSIDTFFVEENTGIELEKASRAGKVYAEVRVLGEHAVLRSIIEKN